MKRIHEYKRQLLNILGIIYRYKKMKEMSPEERKAKFVPRVCIFGGKAFATYIQAKRIVKFITDVGATVNCDRDIGDLLKVCFWLIEIISCFTMSILVNNFEWVAQVYMSLMFQPQVVFVPDYNVSVAEVLIPGSELSQHIRFLDSFLHNCFNYKLSLVS